MTLRNLMLSVLLCAGVAQAAPTVSLGAPANNAKYLAPATLNVSATATPSSGTSISKVEFYQGTTLIGTDTTRPYSVSWANVPAGTYSLTAKATDSVGGVTTSAVRTVTVNAANTAPTVSLSAPAANAQYYLPASLTVTASASGVEANTPITQVEFYANGTLIGTDTTSPYSIAWANPAAGTYSLTAKATDSAGGVTTSAARTVTITGNDTAPTVSLSAPAANAKYLAPANITLTASANGVEANTPITQVEFLNGSTVLATLTAAPYTWTWNNAPVGTHSLTARATDSGGAVGTSAARSITVSGSNLVPTIALTAPANNATVQAPVDVVISANATAPEANDTVTQVEFYQGSTLIGTATQSPWKITWVKPAAGVYTLTAKATDGQGATTTSASRKLTVLANQLPGISLTSPTANQNFTSPANITLTATASDPDGTLTKVEFYQGSTLIGTATSPPYSVTWNNVQAGNYSLTAKATDNGGGETFSAAIAITVGNAGPKLYYLHADHLNTPRLITDEQGNTVWRNLPTSEPFGNTPPESDPNNTGNNFEFNLRFPGQYADKETNTHYNYFRDYNPQTGRYVQSDPIGLAGGINTYTYVKGQPLRFSDPKGLQIPYDDFGVFYPPPESPPLKCSCDDKYKVSLRCFIITVDITTSQSIPSGGWSVSWIGLGPSGVGGKSQLVKVCKCVTEDGWYFGLKGTGSAGIGPVGGEASGTLQIYPPGVQGSAAGAASSAGYATPGLSGQVGSDANVRTYIESWRSDHCRFFSRNRYLWAHHLQAFYRQAEIRVQISMACNGIAGTNQPRKRIASKPTVLLCSIWTVLSP